MRKRGAVLALFGICTIVGCSSSPSGAPPTSTSAPTSSTTLPTSAARTTPPATSSAENLPVTDDVSNQLVQTAAALNSLPATAYTGLAPGTAFYAFDAATGTYWAGAALVPSSSSLQAQVSVQDDGSYILFSKPTNGTWTARSVGLTGTADGSPCPVAVPASVLVLWGWAPGTCRAPE
jgi:hypothetical protein